MESHHVGLPFIACTKPVRGKRSRPLQRLIEIAFLLFFFFELRKIAGKPIVIYPDTSDPVLLPSSFFSKPFFSPPPLPSDTLINMGPPIGLGYFYKTPAGFFSAGQVCPLHLQPSAPGPQRLKAQWGIISEAADGGKFYHPPPTNKQTSPSSRVIAPLLLSHRRAIFQAPKNCATPHGSKKSPPTLLLSISCCIHLLMEVSTDHGLFVLNECLLAGRQGGREIYRHLPKKSYQVQIARRKTPPQCAPV